MRNLICSGAGHVGRPHTLRRFAWLLQCSNCCLSWPLLCNSSPKASLDAVLIRSRPAQACLADTSRLR